MGDWLVGNFAVFGITGQSWMLIIPAIIMVSILISWWTRR
jgi:hypothetical protein